MASEIDILVKASQEGLENITTAADKINDLGGAAEDLGDTGAGGINAMAFAVGQFTGTVALELIKQAPEIVTKLNDMGTASIRAKNGFQAMGGNLDTIQAMQDATKGLADDTDLLSAATELMSSKAVTTRADLVEFAKDAVTLGITFQGDAKKGIETFTTALESVGNVRSLRTLGIDTDAVKTKFEELKKTMDDKDAWRMAIFEEAGKNADKLAGNLDGTGTAIERFKVRIGDFVEGVGEQFSSWLDDTLNKVDRLFGGSGGSSGVQHPENSGLGGLKGREVSGPPLPAGYGTGHSSQYGDVSGEGEGYGMYDQGGSGSPTPKRDAATIEKPKITAAEFDAIVRSANAASAATVGFGAAGALAMGGLALSSAVAASQIGNITTQGNGALSILKQLEVQLQTLASLTIVVNATTQGGGGTGSSRSGSGRGGGVQGPPR